jgi:hypothetical protein
VARHKRDYCGEPFTARIGFKCTATLRAELVGAARSHAARISDFTRAIVIAHLAEAPIAIASQRSLEIDANFRSIISTTHTLNPIRSLLNQIARHVNWTGELGPFGADLRETISACERAADRLAAAADKIVAG